MLTTVKYDSNQLSNLELCSCERLRSYYLVQFHKLNHGKVGKSRQGGGGGGGFEPSKWDCDAGIRFLHCDVAEQTKS